MIDIKCNIAIKIINEECDIWPKGKECGCLLRVPRE